MTTTAQHDDPPQHIASEMALLGCLLQSRDAVTAVADRIRTEHLYRPAHQAIHAAILDMYLAGTGTDPVTVEAELQRRGELDRVGGAIYLHKIVEFAPVAANVDGYAAEVLDAYGRRTVDQLGATLSAYAHSSGADTADVLQRAQDRITEAIDDRSTAGGAPTVDALVAETFDDLHAIEQGNNTGLPTGFTDLDRLTNGLYPGQLITVAARPGIGKSTLGMDFARAAAIQHGVGSVVFSLEMGRSEMMMRLLSAEAKIRLNDMRGGAMTSDDWNRLHRRLPQVQNAPLLLDEVASLTSMDVAARSRKWKQALDNNLGLIVVDYLQLMSSTKRVESRQQEVSEFSRNLKLLAKELDVPIVAVSQLNRSTEQRLDKKPHLADLRESGSIEQDSDMVILVHRPDAYERDDPRMGEADLILAKHRAGPTSTVTVAHQLHYSRFVDMAQD